MGFSDGSNQVTEDQIIDSREVIARLEYLDGLAEVAADPEAEDEYANEANDERRAAVEEYNALKVLAEEGEYLPDWEFGVTLIREDYFEDYARELAGDIGAIDQDAGWPLMHIDWEAAAASLLVDYTELDFDGTTYYAR